MKVDTAILCVCLGNICRSPLCQGILESKLKKLDLPYRVDSCGTGDWHEGEPPHTESIRIARERGITISHQRARALNATDREAFTIILAMDRRNRRDIKAILGEKSPTIYCLREFDPFPESLDVPDPYYGAPGGFREVFDIIERSVDGFVEFLKRERQHL